MESKTFDDRSETVIEDGAITTTVMTTNDINCLFTIRAPSVVTDSISSPTNLTIGSSASTIYDLSILTKPSSENSTKAASTVFVNTAINNALSGPTTWYGTQGCTGAAFIFATQTAGNTSSAPATTTFVGTAINNVLFGAYYMDRNARMHGGFIYICNTNGGKHIKCPRNNCICCNCHS